MRDPKKQAGSHAQESCCRPSIREERAQSKQSVARLQPQWTRKGASLLSCERSPGDFRRGPLDAGRIENVLFPPFHRPVEPLVYVSRNLFI